MTLLAHTAIHERCFYSLDLQVRRNKTKDKSLVAEFVLLHFVVYNVTFLRRDIQIIFFLTVFHYYVLIKSINVGNGDPGKLRYRQQIDQLVHSKQYTFYWLPDCQLTDHQQQTLLRPYYGYFCYLSCSHSSIAYLIKTFSHGHAYMPHVSKMQPNLLVGV